MFCQSNCSSGSDPAFENLLKLTTGDCWSQNVYGPNAIAIEEHTNDTFNDEFTNDTDLRFIYRVNLGRTLERPLAPYFPAGDSKSRYSVHMRLNCVVFRFCCLRRILMTSLLYHTVFTLLYAFYNRDFSEKKNRHAVSAHRVCYWVIVNRGPRNITACALFWCYRGHKSITGDHHGPTAASASQHQQMMYEHRSAACAAHVFADRS